MWTTIYSGAFRGHDDVIKWKHFPRYWPFVRGIHRSPGNSPHKGQWRGALVFSLIGGWINGWVNNGEAGDFRRNGANYDVIVMKTNVWMLWFNFQQRYSMLWKSYHKDFISVIILMMTSWYWNALGVTSPLPWESSGHRWIPSQTRAMFYSLMLDL